ncbi:(Fe-S)-binding protein [Dendrosporobacter sp. 1207_IL3150]|uniref:(Fe-S)-binding protein n=1 Tax=Dendrosporobacter sp. 1207_IL3150 TaxID=3084054 RepID=UPI002FD90F56
MKASLFITCIADMMYADVGKSVVRVLRRHGVDLDFPEGQTCCGQPAYSSGYHKEAAVVAKKIIEVFERSERVVMPSGSCASMIHHGYPTLFKGDPVWEKRANEFIKKTYEFSQFIVDVLGVTDVGATFNKKVTYHSSCHMARLLGIEEQPKLLLKNVKGIDFVELPYAYDCCGFGGTFSMKMADISGAIVDEKVDNIIETGAEVLAGCDLTCLMNISGRLTRRGVPIKVMHLAQILDQGV